MTNRKHGDNSSMSIQIKFNKEESELNETDVNGNSDKFVNSELETTYCHGRMISPDTNFSGSQITCENSLHIKRQNGSKLLPLRISKARLPSFPETNKDNNNASSLHQNSKPSKSAKDQSIFKTGKCKNIFSDFSMSHFSEVRHARTDISVKIGGPNNKRQITDKQQQQKKYPKLQVSLTLNEKEPEKDLMSMTASDILHSVTHDKINGNPQSLSILVCEFDTSDDNFELKSNSQNVTLTDSDSFFCSSSQEACQLTGDHIPQLSPISNHRADNFYMLPSPQYSLQPPILTPISEDQAVRTESDKSFYWLKTETNTQESSTVCTSHKKSKSTLTPVHISAVKEALKRTCHALESTCGEKIHCDFKDKNILLQRSDEIMCNRSEKFYDSLKTLDNVEKLTTEENITPEELLAISTKDIFVSSNHGENSMQNDITRNKNTFGDDSTLRDDNTATNDTESNTCNENSKVYKMTTERNESKEAGVKLFNDADENNQLKSITESLGSVDRTLMHSEVKTSRQSELILSSLEPQMAANIVSFNSVHAKTKPNSTESLRVPASIASSVSTEDCRYSTSLERECCDGSVENSNTEQLRTLKPAFPTQKATHKREPDKLSSACNPAATNEVFKPFLMEQVSEPQHSVAPTHNQKDPSMSPSATPRDVSGLKTDNMKAVLPPDTEDQMSQHHDSRLRGAAFCTEKALKPTSSCDVTLSENPQQLSQSKPNPLPAVSAQMCTAFEKDLFLDMYFKDERQPPSVTSRENIVSTLQLERSSDVHTLSATKRPSSDNHHSDQSLKISKGGLGSQGQSANSTFQSKYVEAISRDLMPRLQPVISPRHYKIMNTTGSNVLSPETCNLSIRADNISPCYDNHAKVSSNDTFTSTANTVTSQPNVVRATHIDARDFKVSASDTLRIVSANPTVISVSSTDALVSQTNASTASTVTSQPNVVRATHIDARDFKVSASDTLSIVSANPTVISVSSADTLVSQAHAHASYLLPQKVKTSPNNITKPSTKLDPDAVKNMSHHIIHHSSRRHISYPKETTHKKDQRSSVYTTQPTAVTMTPHAMTSHAMTSHTVSASHISQNVHKSKRSSVISMANSPKAKTQHRQLQMSSTEPAQTMIYFPCEASVPIRQNYNNNQSTWQPIKMDNKYIEITEHTNSEHVFTHLNPDHVLANSTYFSPYHRELVRKASITSSSSLNYHSAGNGIGNGPTMLYTQQQVSRSENQQVPFGLVSSAEPYQSANCYNVFNHVPDSGVANENRRYLHTSELANGADCSTLVHVQGANADRSGQFSDFSNLHSSGQATIHEADDCMEMRIFSHEAEDSAQTHEFPIRTEDFDQTFKMPYEVEGSSETCEFLKEAQDSSQTGELPNIAEDSAQTSEFSNEPLDLSLPKEKKHIPFSIEEVLVDLTSEDAEPIVKMSPPSIETSVCQPNMSVGENITVSPVVTTYRPSREEVCSKPTICHNKDLLVSSNMSSKLPQNSMVNSLPTPVSSARHQVICHRSPLLETALRHNIMPKDRDPHPFNTVVPECLITQPSSSDEPECRPLPNSQIDFKTLHVSQTASSQPPKLPSSTITAVPANDHTCFVTSATVISLPVSQSSQSLMSLLANTEVSKNKGCSSNKQTGQHPPSAVPTSQEKRTSGLTMQQQIANSQSNSYIASTSRHPSNNVVVCVGSVSPKVVPLPVKDFFTHTPKENSYSALLMAKITKNKQSHGYQKVNELLRNYRSQNSYHRCSLEIGNHLQRSFIIDLTDSDDDCKLLSVSPQENPTRVSRTRNLHVSSKNHDSNPEPEIADSCATEITNAHKDNTKDLNSVDSLCASGFSTVPSNLKDPISLENALPVNTANNNTGKPDVYIVDVESNETYHSQEQHEMSKNKTYECVPHTENNVPAKMFFTPGMLETDKPAKSLHLSSDCTHSHAVNENADKTARTTNSRAFSSSGLDLKIDSPGKELMAKKLQSAMSMRTNPEELTQRVFPLPLSRDNKVGAHTEAQQSPVCSFGERVQISTGTTSVHDNSTQRAAATLLELSANPIYNPFLISPESCGDFQEKVYQIHPVLSEDENNKWGTAKDGQNNRLDVQNNQCFNATGTKASKNRSCRRVGRPPKDQYSSSDSVTSVKSNSVSANNTIPTSVSDGATTITPGETKLLHSVTPYSCSNVIVHPQNVAYESQTPIVSIEPDALVGIFRDKYDFTAQNQLITDGHGSTIPAKENQPLRGNRESQARNIIESSGHNTNSSPQFSERTFASVASKTASDMIYSNTSIQAMTLNNVTHLSNGLYVVHNSNTRTLFSKSPANNISGLENIPRGQSEYGGLAADQQNQNHYVTCSLPSASTASDCLINTNQVFTHAKECNSDTDKRSKARKRKYQNCNSKEDKTAQSHSISAEAVSNTNDFHSGCFANRCTSTEDFTTQRNDSNEYHELSKNNKKKRTPKGRGRKRKSKARNKNSKISHLENADEEDLNLNSRNPQNNPVNTRQAKKSKQPEKFYFQDDDDQTIQYGLDNLQMTDNYVPISSTSAGLPVSDHLDWTSTMVSGDTSISDGMSNMDKNEHQKELEVTSLLAFMMCNKYKGQV